MIEDLFPELETGRKPRETMAEGAVLMRGRALALDDALLAGVEAVTAVSPFRHLTTPGGFVMSVAMTNCGAVGWISDQTGYRYDPVDPETGRPWPAMPETFRALAVEAAAEAGYPGYAPDVCLINRYEPGARLSLHQDRDERHMPHPIVSISLGLPATFQFGGLARNAPVARYALRHGDVAVWGGPSRLFFHGVSPLKEGAHPKLGRKRINLTFRRAR